MLSFIYSKSSWFLKDKTNVPRTRKKQPFIKGSNSPIPPQFSPFTPTLPPPNHYSVMVAVHNVYNSSKQEALFPAVFVNVGTNQTIGYFYLLQVKKRVIFVKFW